MNQSVYRASDHSVFQYIGHTRFAHTVQTRVWQTVQILCVVRLPFIGPVSANNCLSYVVHVHVFGDFWWGRCLKRTLKTKPTKLDHVGMWCSIFFNFVMCRFSSRKSHHDGDGVASSLIQHNSKGLPVWCSHGASDQHAQWRRGKNEAHRMRMHCAIAGDFS